MQKVIKIEIIATIKEMQAKSELVRKQGKKIAFVPTMGFLHEGHLSLLSEGKRRGDYLVLSIFVNPTQFGPEEDLESYPRSIERDLNLAEKEGVDAVFTPDKSELYGKGFQTYVKLDELPNHLCGVSRPVHFRGVATVVTKLFNIVKPHIAIFGEKDFQQLAVIRQMTSDLNFDIEIVGGQTVREHDGLAMSSRNTNLSSEQRSSAQVLNKSLKKARELVNNGEKDAEKIIGIISELITSCPETNIDYIALCDPYTLEDLKIVDKPVVMALAVKVGKTRLIDNAIIKPF
jgi:pantoate--beta-alanine ligase